MVMPSTLRDKHNISMATRERQPPPAQSKTTSIYNTVLSLYIKVPYPNIIQVILWRFKIIKLKKSAWFPAIWWSAVGICLQECGHTKEEGWGEWKVDMNVPSLNSFWKVGYDMPLLVFKPSLCHLPPFYLVLCHCFQAMSLGSKTSHCSGNEPALLNLTDGWMYELSIVNCYQSDHCLFKSSRQHKLNWVVPEKIHTPATDGILEILAGGGVEDSGNPGGRGGWP